MNWVLKLAEDDIEKEKLEEKVKKLTKELYTDPLTGLYSRRFLEDKFDELIKDKSFHIIMFDVDDFKEINDTYGHDVGDKVLKSVGQKIKDLTKEGDYVGRYGGEEFIVLSVEKDDETVDKLANRIREVIKVMKVDDIDVTVSGGVASSERSLDETFKLADEALYVSKETGKDKVTIYSPEMKKDYHKDKAIDIEEKE